jgi:MFS family permease
VIGDITTARERGGLIGVFGGSECCLLYWARVVTNSLVRMMGQSIGPVFGGILTQFLGFRSIFWFLFGLGSITLLLILLLLPETLRSIAGNGTLRLAGIYRPLIYMFSPPSDVLIDRDSTPKKELTLSGVAAPLKFLFEKDVFITLFFGSIVYTVWSMVTSSTTFLFQSHFHLNDLQVGLAFLPNGAGCVAGSYLTGYLMDYDYRVIEAQYRTSKNIPKDMELNKKDLVDFPIEKSRLRNIWWIVLIFIAATAGYGFSFNLNLIAIPLIFQFFIAYTATAVFSLNSALVIDLYPGASASATAVNNLMRCSVGAIGVAVVQIVINEVGAGLSFLAFAVVTAVASPLLVLEWVYGESWRWERRERLNTEQEKIENVENAEVVTRN